MQEKDLLPTFHSDVSPPPLPTEFHVSFDVCE